MKQETKHFQSLEIDGSKLRITLTLPGCRHGNYLVFYNPNPKWTLETDKPKPQLFDNVVGALVKSLEKGDRIILKPTTNFFVQDIALYSGFRFNIYYSWDLTASE